MKTRGVVLALILSLLIVPELATAVDSSVNLIGFLGLSDDARMSEYHSSISYDRKPAVDSSTSIVFEVEEYAYIGNILMIQVRAQTADTNLLFSDFKYPMLEDEALENSTEGVTYTPQVWPSSPDVIFDEQILVAKAHYQQNAFIGQYVYHIKGDETPESFMMTLSCSLHDPATRQMVSSVNLVSAIKKTSNSQSIKAKEGLTIHDIEIHEYEICRSPLFVYARLSYSLSGGATIDDAPIAIEAIGKDNILVAGSGSAQFDDITWIDSIWFGNPELFADGEFILWLPSVEKVLRLLDNGEIQLIDATEGEQTDTGVSTPVHFCKVTVSGL